MDQNFSERNFWRVLQKGDGDRFSLGRTRKDIRGRLREIAEHVNREDFTFAPLRTQTRNGNLVFSVGSVDDEFVLRKLADNLRRALMVRVVDRNVIVPQVITLVKEARASKIIKMDIARFFESVDKNTLLRELRAEDLVSSKTYKLINDLLWVDQLKDKPGLPRGLSVSSVLAEYYLSRFEQKCRCLPFCYQFVRYVDDMIFFCHGDADSILQDVEKLLPSGLKLNPGKTKKIAIDSKKNIITTGGFESSFSYLGYELIFSENGRIEVSIPKKKISKIKTRIIYSLLDYCKSRRFDLLVSRVRFLTSNFKLSDSSDRGILYSGIYYNHQYANNAACEAVFREIDNFFVRAVYSRNGSLGRRLHPILTNAQRKELCSHSFLNGYKNKVRRDFSHKNLAEIKEVWCHA